MAVIMVLSIIFMTVFTLSLCKMADDGEDDALGGLDVPEKKSREPEDKS